MGQILTNDEMYPEKNMTKTREKIIQTLKWSEEKIQQDHDNHKLNIWD